MGEYNMEAAREIAKLIDERDQLQYLNNELLGALEDVKSSGLLVGSTVLHDEIRGIVLSAINKAREMK